MPLYRGTRIRAAESLCPAGDRRLDQGVGAEQAERVAQAEAVAGAHVSLQPGPCAVAVVGHRGVPAQAGDHRVDVVPVGVDPHPAARRRRRPSA